MTARRTSDLFLVAAVLSLALTPVSNSANASPPLSVGRAVMTWTLQGRVYEGPIEDETHALPGVTVSVYGANDPYPNPGVLIDATATDAEGWWGLDVQEGYEFYHIRESDAQGYTSVGATTVGGMVQDANWISYEVPLDEKTLTGNKFWDQPPLLSGRVYEGAVGDESAPLPGVTVELYCSDDADQRGEWIDETLTDSEGWYGLHAYGGCEFYNIFELDPEGYVSAGATSVGGDVKSADWIQYAIPLPGQTHTGNKFWDEPAPTAPDLTVVGLWSEAGELCYQVANLGTTPAPEGHVTVVEIDGVEVSALPVEVILAPDESVEACIDWACGGAEDDIVVTADAAAVVAESDETNNTASEVWPCDTLPPEIVDGPDVSGVTSNSAVISWETDEPADGQVFFGDRAQVLDRWDAEPALVTNHEISLTGLAPATTYQFYVRSTDSAGNGVQSGTRSFETGTLPDDQDPAVGLRDPGVVSGTVTVEADADDDDEVEKVVFHLDGERVFTDFSAPYQWPFASLDVENGEHLLHAWAYDRSGRSAMGDLTIDVGNVVDLGAPVVNIYHPGDGAAVYGQTPVYVTISDEPGWGDVTWYVDGKKLGGGQYPFSAMLDLNPAFWWDTRYWSDGPHTLGVQATDGGGRVGTDTVTVQVSNGPATWRPKLAVTTHEAFRHSSMFAIELTLTNKGQYEASGIVIENPMTTFQPVSRTFGAVTYEADLDTSTLKAKSVIRDPSTLAPGSSRTYYIAAAPVLRQPKQPAPSIGKGIKLAYRGPFGNTYQETVTFAASMSGGGSLQGAFDNALQSSNYLMVTNPGQLAFGNTAQDVDAVLSDMAELAWERAAVLGYLSTTTRSTIDSLVEPGGAWANKLHKDFRTAEKGYLLIVGETEIVPSWNLSVTPSSCTWCPSQVEHSDHPYADDAGGGNWHPELIVGRIIGNDAADLSTALRASFEGVGFDRSDALVVSGTGGGQPKFVKNVDDVESELQDEGFSVEKLHWKDWSTDAQRLTQFRNRADDADVLYFRDHCDEDEWSPALETNDFPVNFGSVNPFAFGCCCSSGDYERGDDENIAEAFFDSGASVYIGSTEDSPRDCNSQAGLSFYKKWGANETIGHAFIETERGFPTTGSWAPWWRYWVAEYNVYGDPAFGAAPASLQASQASTALQPPPTMVHLTVPDYEVTEAGGLDRVEIPGGSTVMAKDQPVVPSYSTDPVPLAAGYRIQDVLLVERSGLSVTTGLELGVAGLEPDAGRWPREVGAVEDDGWFPAETYDWSVRAGSSGADELLITVYPFIYNAATTEAAFYRSYDFEIVSTTSTVTLTEVSVGAAEYGEGETIEAHIEIINAGTAQDVVVDGSVRRYGTGELVDGLLLTTLHDLEGPASFAPAWESGEAAPGYYSVDVALRDTRGHLLDQRSETFRLGMVSGAAELAAWPERFDVGQTVTVSLTFSNTGSLPITGTASVEIWRDGKGMVEGFEWHEGGLPPGEQAAFVGGWDTTGEVGGDYTVVGYVSYDSQATETEMVRVSTLRRVYLPMVMRDTS